MAKRNITQETILDDLNEFFYCSDHFCGIQSNFSTCVSVVKSLENSESIYSVNVPNFTMSDDGIFHMKLINNLEYITKLKKIRKVYYHLVTKEIQEVLFLAHNQNKNKFHYITRSKSTIKHKERYFDLSAICFAKSKFANIQDFEKHVFSMSDKDYKTQMLENAKEEFFKALKIFEKKYMENEK